MLTFSSINAPGNLSTSMMVNICAGLFILPFLFFSAFAGVMADLREKSYFIKNLKKIEIITVLMGAFGIFTSNVYFMWLALFCMGVQAAFFGPLKYSILPQHLDLKELMGGNGLIESGTFVAILIGTIMGGVLIGLDNGKYYVSALMVCFAFIGYLSSRHIPLAPSFADKNAEKISFFGSFRETLSTGKKIKSVFLSTLAISWFWFLGATLLAQFPLIVKDVMKADPTMVTTLLAVFAIGMAVGSVLCEKLSGHKVEHGLVPFGAFGMTVFLYLFGANLDSISTSLSSGFFNPSSSQEGIAALSVWLSNPDFYYVMSSLFMISIFSGFFTVPLYAFIQYRTDEKDRSKVIGSNNIWNSLFMVSSAVFAVVLSQMGISLVNMIYILTAMNFLVAVWVFTVVPEFLFRFIVWILINTIYRIDTKNVNTIPDNGSGIIICNHVSFMDALFIFGLAPRPVKFVMYYKIYNIPVANWFFKSVGAIPIASKTENEKICNEAFDKISQYLNDGELVVIFPEGGITHDGEMAKFKPGILKTLQKNPVPVYPCALSGLWGSMYSRKDKGFTRFFPKAFFNHKVQFSVGEKLDPQGITTEKLEEIVLTLRGNNK